ncbi:cytochrome c/c1 heme-lyase [Phycomyces blakesleeanus]|uniref:Holocytochrome c-type synthase n=1 Tax=Phycomyces blakesleeanus TaxID=4837 RepID=A0ABR3BE25_PHYBL
MTPSPMTPPPGCPMHEPKKETPPPGCPMHKSDTPVTDKLNELNMMPNLTQDQYADQSMELPTERTISSIPKAKDADSKWEYPSPQQFYNALRRKGWETPEEHVETMVDIHNFLNEEAWNEVLKWESKFGCECKEDPYLSRFQGRPQELSPKARWHSFFGGPKPFDRHDWFVNRCGEERRYVIDYYEAPEEVPGVPVFHLDIRPAIDSPEAAFFRIKEAAKEKWAQWFSSPASNQTA